MSLFNPPDPPDPAAALSQAQSVAAGQQAYNTAAGTQSQAGSAVNQYNPYGSLTYSQTGTGPGGVPMWTSNLQLTPQQQQMFDILAGTKKTAGQAGQDLISGANYGSAQPKDVIGGMTSGLTGQLMAKQQEYYQPFFNMEREQLDTKLRNQGLLPSSDPTRPSAYDNAMRALDTNHGLVISKAASDFEGQAFDQASKLYGMPWMLGKEMAGFGAPGDVKSELVDTPKLNIQPANLIGATSNANDMLMKQYEAQAKKSGDAMSGLFGIPTALLGGWAKAGFPGAGEMFGGLGTLFSGAGEGLAGLFGGMEGLGGLGAVAGEAAMLSDERLKEDIVPVGSLVDSTPVYSYRYKGDPTPRIGLMAQDVEQDTPEAVTEVGGYKAVNYRKATERSRNMVEALRRTA